MAADAAMKRMMAARTTLVLDHPFWGTLALRLRLVEDRTCKTAWVNGVTLGFNPAYIMGLPFQEVVAVVAHEVGHCVLGHPWRRDGREHNRWNEACDRSLNPVLREAQFVLPEGVLFELDPTHKGKSAEWVYNRLPHPLEDQGGAEGSGNAGDEGEPGGSGAGEPQDGDGDSKSQEDGDEGTGDEDTTGDGGESGDGEETDDGNLDEQDPLGEVRDAPAEVAEDDEDNNPNEDAWQQAVQQAAALAQGQGKLPGSLARFAEQATESRVDWRSVLLRFAQETTRSDYSWTRPNPRYISHGLYLPALYAQEMGPIVVLVDTSGSVDQTLLNIFGAALQGVVTEMQPRRVHVLYCDAAVQHEDVFERDDIVTLTPHGGGGTDFRPGLRRLAELDEVPVCAVYLTDLLGSFPTPGEIDVPVLWATPKRYAQKAVPFGEVVHVDE